MAAADLPPAPRCTHCDGVPVLVTGADVYPNRRDLADRPIWVCPCGARVGCHPGTLVSLGRAANAELRNARGHLHNLLDPIWRDAWKDPSYWGPGESFETKGAPRTAIMRVARVRVYEFLASRMGLTEDDCHVGMFDLEQCRQAYRILRGRTYSEIRLWAKARRPPPKEASHADENRTEGG